MGRSDVSQKELVLAYYKSRKDEAVPHAEMVDFVTAQYFELTGKPLRDPDRAARTLYGEGKLQKIGTGLYKFSAETQLSGPDNNFSASTKRLIFEADNYQCRICGRGPKEGLVLQADHIKPRANGGLATFENGQTLCSECNILKKNYDHFKFGKKLYEKYLDQALHANDAEMITFCQEILQVFERHNRL